MAYSKEYGVEPEKLTSGGNVPPKRMRRKKKGVKAEKEFPRNPKQKSMGIFDKILKAFE